MRPFGSKFFSFRADPFSKGEKKEKRKKNNFAGCLPYKSIHSLLTFTTFWANLADDKFIFFLFFPENRIWHFMQMETICIKCHPMETICMKCQILLSGKNKKKYFNMLSDENFTQIVKH